MKLPRPRHPRAFWSDTAGEKRPADVIGNAVKVNLEAGVLLDVGDGGLERMAVEGIAVKRFDVQDELPASIPAGRCAQIVVIRDSVANGSNRPFAENIIRIS